MNNNNIEFNRDKLWYMLLLLILFISIFATVNHFKFDILKGYKISYRNMYNKYLSDSKIEEIREDLNIKDIDYNWSEELVYNNKPTQIIYHHAASSNETPEEINEYHKSKGWSGIGYDYYIRKDGTIYSGRPEGAEGAHAIGQNKNSIGICLEGNFEDEELSSEQVSNLYKLSVYISFKYDIYRIIGHKDVGETLCPGKNFPIEKIKESVIKGIKEYDTGRNDINESYKILE